MYAKTLTARIIGKTEEPRFFGGKRYKLAYEIVNDQEIIAGSMKVDFATFCRLNVGDRFDKDVYSADGIVWTDSPAKATLDGVLGVYIHPSLRENSLFLIRGQEK